MPFSFRRLAQNKLNAPEQKHAVTVNELKKIKIKNPYKLCYENINELEVHK